MKTIKTVIQRGMKGRNKVSDKKIQVTLYIRQSIINSYEGKANLIESINESLGNE